MFTGLIEEIATVRHIVRTTHSARLSITAKGIMADMKLGDSIAVNGVCLTVTDFGSNWFTLDAVPETMRRTNLGTLKIGSKVNVERAMQLSSRFGGHIVSGHIDGVGTLKVRREEDLAVVLTFETTEAVMRYVVGKGSICVNGVSLTVMEVDTHSFSVSVIPHTGVSTTLLSSRVGDVVNLECDVLAKYVEKLLFAGQSGDDSRGNRGATESPGVTMAFLAEHGFV